MRQVTGHAFSYRRRKPGNDQNDTLAQFRGTPNASGIVQPAVFAATAVDASSGTCSQSGISSSPSSQGSTATSGNSLEPMCGESRVA